MGQKMRNQLLLLCMLVGLARGNPTCDLFRGMTPTKKDLVISSNRAVAAGETLSPVRAGGNIWVTNGAVLIMEGTSSHPSVVGGNLILDGSTLYAEGKKTSFVIGPAQYSGQYYVLSMNNASFGVQTQATMSFGPGDHFITNFFVCDHSALYFDNPVLEGSTQPAPFLFENGRLVLNNGVGPQALFETTIRDSGSASLTNSQSISFNVYFTINSDVSGSNIIAPAAGTQTSTFKLGTSQIDWTSSNVFIGGFWVESGAKAVFQDTPNLLLFISLYFSSNVTNLSPRTYSGSTAPFCFDEPCTIELGFINSATYITNVYWNGPGQFGIFNSTVGELSVFDTGSSGVARNTTVDGSGGFLGVKGALEFEEGKVTATVSASAHGVGRFYNTTFAKTHFWSPSRLISAADHSTLVLAGCPVPDPKHFTLVTASSGLIVQSRWKDSFPSSIDCAALGGVLDVTDYYSLTAYFQGSSTQTFSVHFAWDSDATSTNFSPAQVTGVEWSDASAKIDCPSSDGLHNLHATVLPVGRNSAVTTITKSVTALNTN